MGRRATGGGRSRVDPQTEAIAARRLAGLFDQPPARRAVVAGPRTAAAFRDDLEDCTEAPDRRDGTDSPARAAAATVSPPPPTGQGPAGAIEPAPVRRVGGAVGQAREFGRRHLGVIAIVVVAALAAAGWALIRARPVAEATPVTMSTAATAGPAGSSAASGSPMPPSPGRSSAPTTMLVHVLGAVRRPGVVTLTPGARVEEAITRAGGLLSDARPGELNLAQPLQDGQQIRIGTRARPGGEVRDPGVGSGGPGPAGGGSARSSGGAAGPLNLNTADVTQLDLLPGVGPVTAERIIAWRTANGRFNRIEELQEVEGIGPKTYAQLVPYVRV